MGSGVGLAEQRQHRLDRAELAHEGAPFLLEADRLDGARRVRLQVLVRVVQGWVRVRVRVRVRLRVRVRACRSVCESFGLGLGLGVRARLQVFVRVVLGECDEGRHAARTHEAHDVVALVADVQHHVRRLRRASHAQPLVQHLDEVRVEVRVRVGVRVRVRVGAGVGVGVGVRVRVRVRVGARMRVGARVRVGVRPDALEQGLDAVGVEHTRRLFRVRARVQGSG